MLDIVLLLLYSAYELALWSFVIALVHFASETFVYKTAKLGPGIISPFIVACKSLSLSYRFVPTGLRDVTHLSYLYRLILCSLLDSFKYSCHVPSLRRLRQVAPH